jgi:hypothetical protein
MSDPIRVGFVVEGPTDRLILEAVVTHLLGEREYEPVQLAPELSDTFAATSGGGWAQVYFWCRQTAEQAGGGAGNHALFETFDVVIVQIDADVAGKAYGDDQRITQAPGDLPCQRPCPPASDTTGRLRAVMLGWMGEANIPPKITLCTPSKSLETWILVALFPQNRFCTEPDIECRHDPETQLQSQPLAVRLIRGGKKVIAKYAAVAPEVAREWPRVRLFCSEGERFSVEFAQATASNH